MAFCSNCGKEIPEGAAMCPSCGAVLTGTQDPSAPAEVVVEAWDHTAEYDAKDISDHKVYALTAYLFGIFGVLLCSILGKDSPYAAFHAREALKLNVTMIVVWIISVFLVWTCIVPFAGIVLLVILSVVRIICFVQVCKGKAKEPWLIRSIGALH